MGTLCNQLASYTLGVSLFALTCSIQGQSSWTQSLGSQERVRDGGLAQEVIEGQTVCLAREHGSARQPPSQHATSYFASEQVVREIPVAGVLDDLQGETKFEASGIAQRGHNSGQYFVVFDK